MSFILDALKKSESDRQRQNGPGLYEAKVAAPRSQLPYWAIGLAVLLGVNLVIVAWALLRRPSHGPADTAATPSVTAPAPPASAPAPAPAVPAASPSVPPVTAQALPPATTPPAGTRAPTSAGPQGPERDPALGNPEDYAPATEPSPSSSVAFHVRRGTDSGVPLYSEAATAPGSGVPELRLDLHAYAVKPQERFVLINMKKLREGDSLPEGVKVETITPDGVILSHHGSRFLLPRE